MTDPYTEKAYIVYEDYEGSAVVAIGTPEIMHWTIKGYERRKRAPWADKYKEGKKVPASKLVNMGWKLKCGYCGDIITNKWPLITKCHGYQFDNHHYCSTAHEILHGIQRRAS